MSETRKEQHIRILTNGIRDKDDWLEAAYLHDKGYAKCPYIKGNGMHNHGQIISIVWRGITADGMDYLDNLKQQVQNTYTHKNTAKESPASHSPMPQAPPVEQKLWHERSTWRALIFSLAVAVIGGIILMFIAELI